MNISEMRSQVTVEQKTTTADGIGGRLTSWTPRAQYRAKIDTAKPSQRWAGDGLRTEFTHVITVRYGAELTGDIRLNYKGRVFGIVGQQLDNEQTPKFVNIFCDEDRVK